MSFFTNGFAGMVHKRRQKMDKKAAKRDNNGKSSGKDGNDKKEDKKDEEGRWDMLTDAYGRTYWQHSVTGEWSYGNGGLVSPAGTVIPSPMGFAGAAVFTPSPVPPAGYAPYPFVVAPPPKKEKAKAKDEDKKKGKGVGGVWETMYDDDGDRYWEHTVTKKTTYKDPYY